MVFFLFITLTSFLTLAYATPLHDSTNASLLSAIKATSIIKPDDKTTQANDKPNTGNPVLVSQAGQTVSLNSNIPNTTKMGLYIGPGGIARHQIFEQWLGKPIPYTTDYIDYNGGWTKDFVDSEVWLTAPWGAWTNQKNGRLVLGVPMLENENYGQFAQGVRGDFDVYFRKLAEELVQNKLGDSIIRLGYEANCDTIGPWQATNDPEGFRQLFRHEVSIMRSVPGSSFMFDWTVCNGLQGGHNLNSYDSFYPGDDVVDIIGIDIYDVKWQDPGITPQARWDYILSRHMGVNDLSSFANNHNKPLSFPEWGLYRSGDNFAGGGDDTTFIRNMYYLINATNPVYQSYFDLDWGGGILSDFRQSEAVFKELFGT